MKLNERLRQYMSWGKHAGQATAAAGELPGMSTLSILPVCFREDRIGDACKRGYEEAMFDAYLTKATGKTVEDVWKDRGGRQ
jgi:hypothetical protein